MAEVGYEEAKRIMRDEVLGVPVPGNESPEAAAFRQQIRKEIDEARANGHALDVPPE